MFPFTIWSFLWFNQHTSNMMLQKFKIIFAFSTHEWIANFHPRLIFHLHEMFTQREWFLRTQESQIEIFIECVILDFRSVSISRCDSVLVAFVSCVTHCERLYQLSFQFIIHGHVPTIKLGLIWNHFNVDFVVNESEYLLCHRDEFSVV